MSDRENASGREGRDKERLQRRESAGNGRRRAHCKINTVPSSRNV